MNRLLVTIFYVGLIKPAPGTWGSFAAVLLLFPIHFYGGPFLLSFLTVLISIVGIYLVKQATAASEDKDPSEVVIDEVAGQWISLLPVSFGAYIYEIELLQLWPGLLLGFILFRFFDILKPWPISWADQISSLGVMLDDIFAGFIVALILLISGSLYYGH